MGRWGGGVGTPSCRGSLIYELADFCQTPKKYATSLNSNFAEFQFCITNTMNRIKKLIIKQQKQSCQRRNFCNCKISHTKRIAHFCTLNKNSTYPLPNQISTWQTWNKLHFPGLQILKAEACARARWTSQAYGESFLTLGNGMARSRRLDNVENPFFFEEQLSSSLSSYLATDRKACRKALG